jgi:hypothetical protein
MKRAVHEHGLDLATSARRTSEQDYDVKSHPFMGDETYLERTGFCYINFNAFEICEI